MFLAKNIKYLRLSHHHSQEDLANELGYRSFTTVQKWESGIAEPPIEKLKKMASMYHVSLSDLIDRDIEQQGIQHLEPLHFDDATAALEFILKQEMVANYGGYDLKLMEDEEIIDMANDMADFLRMISKRRKRA